MAIGMAGIKINFWTITKREWKINMNVLSLEAVAQIVITEMDKNRVTYAASDNGTRYGSFCSFVGRIGFI